MSYVSFEKLITTTFFKDLKRLPQTQQTAFRGWAENAILAVMYLLERNRNQCYVITGLRNRLQTLSSATFRFEDVGLYWKKHASTRFQLVYPGNSKKDYICHIKTCAKERKDARFIVTILNIAIPDSDGLHANILMYDKELGLLERFDPYDVSTETGNLDAELEDLYRTHVDPDIEYIFPPDLSFFSTPGIQFLQEGEPEWKERDQRKYPAGFCMPFTILYADTRMSFPDQTPESITEVFRLFVEKERTTLTDFMRHYSDFINSKFQLLVRTHPKNLLAGMLHQLDNSSASILTDLMPEGKTCSL